MKKPIKSILVNISSRKNHPINAETAGIKKNIDTVLLAEFFFIKNIRMVKAPKETKNIWWHIAIIKVDEKSINGSAKKITKTVWNKHPPIAW